MKQPAQRLSVSAKHVSLVDKICEEIDTEYARVKDELRRLPGYEAIASELYAGQKGRQMVLGDILTYILAGRGYWAARKQDESFRDYIRVIMHTVNLMLIQESILSSRVTQRREFLARLAAENIPHFYADDIEQNNYKTLAESGDQIRPGHSLYKTMDSLLPKSAGVAIGLLVFVYLLKRRIGYVLPLLFTQRIFRGRESLAPPDYLVLRPNGRMIGVQVGGGLGIYGRPSRGKLQQVNIFVQDTNIPVVTANMPHMQYRCPKCNNWPLFCPEIIDRVSNSWQASNDDRYVPCPSCGRFEDGKCPFILYKGQVQVNGEAAHYHYQCVNDIEYVVNRSLKNDKAKYKKLISYFPFVEGLERIPGLSP